MLRLKGERDMRLDDNLNNVYFFKGEFNWDGIFFSNKSRYHHTNGPSRIYSLGILCYDVNGLFHNIKGPAHIGINFEDYYLYSKPVSKEEWASQRGMTE